MIYGSGGYWKGLVEAPQPQEDSLTLDVAGCSGCGKSHPVTFTWGAEGWTGVCEESGKTVYMILGDK